MSDTNQHKGSGRLGVEPKFFNEDTGKPFARLFALMNESYDKGGETVSKATPVYIVVTRKADVELAHEAHTGTAISWTGKLSLREFEAHGEKRMAVDIIIAGPGAKLEVGEAKAKDATPADNARAAVGKREQQASAPSHNQ